MRPKDASIELDDRLKSEWGGRHPVAATTLLATDAMVRVNRRHQFHRARVCCSRLKSSIPPVAQATPRGPDRGLFLAVVIRMETHVRPSLTTPTAYVPVTTTRMQNSNG